MTTATSITVRVPLAIRRRPGRKTVVTPMTEGIAPVVTRADPALVKALARAFRYQRMLDEGRYESITEMAAAEKIERGYLGKILQLTLLPPDVVEKVLSGHASTCISLTRLLRAPPGEWKAFFPSDGCWFTFARRPEDAACSSPERLHRVRTAARPRIDKDPETSYPHTANRNSAVCGCRSDERGREGERGNAEDSVP